MGSIGIIFSQPFATQDTLLFGYTHRQTKPTLHTDTHLFLLVAITIKLQSPISQNNPSNDVKTPNDSQTKQDCAS
jgi:hypothetical protein